ncbi:hemoblobin-interacting domain-containing protein [Paenibacillus xanthanilyticus]|uniref:Hemoblobin-interacting domain-containing protein n=1 Tax=Paenibacillus xanthanilyticus TaxID=1783531 RepID=A0ABV8JXY2_9BACL
MANHAGKKRRQWTALLLSAALMTGPATIGWAAEPGAAATGQGASETAGAAMAGSAGEPVFRDIAGNWSEKQIAKWAKLGLAAGSDGQFRPNDGVSRAEFAKLLNTLFGFRAKAAAAFGDVAATKWYADTVAIAKQAGYIAGYPDGLFKPEQVVTRQEAAKMAAALFPLQAASADTLAAFADQAQVSAFAKEPMAALVAGGYLKGFADGTIRPLAPITRAEAVVLLDRLAGEIANQPSERTGLKLPGGLFISSPDVTIGQSAIAGSVIIAPGVGEGDVTLDGAEIGGTLVISGGGANSVHIRNSKVEAIVVDKIDGPVRVVFEGDTSVGELDVESGAKVEVGADASVGELTITEGADGTDLQVKGTVGKLQSETDGVKLNDRPVQKGGGYEVNKGEVKAAPPKGNSGNGGGSNGGGSSGPPTPPALTADTTDNVVGKDLTITFPDNASWRAAIRKVKLGTKELAPAQYTIAAGQITIAAAAVTEKGSLTVTISASGYPNVTLAQPVGQWDLVWNDEFDGGTGGNFDTNGVDKSKWGYQNGTGAEYGLDGWGNGEQQYYTKDNIEVKDGKLVITAKKQTMSGKPYTSGRLWTSPTFSKTYGKFEARMKLPEGQGLWPAFWMMPKDSEYGVWASSGELDIMEARGRLPHEVGGTIHYGKPWPNNKATGNAYTFPEGESITGYHTYGVEWEPGEIRWYVDGKLYQTLNNWNSQGADQPDKYAYPAPFDKPFYMILNLAVGGQYDGNRLPSDSMLPATMEVDYVRAYELSGKPYRTPIEPQTQKEPIPANAKAAIDGSYIYDPAYTKGLKDITALDQTLDPLYWNFLHAPDFGGAGSGTIETVDGKPYAKVTVQTPGNAVHALQLIQYATLVKGRAYKLSFDAKASANRTIAAKLGGDADNGWGAYSDQFQVPLGTDVKHYEYRFQMTNETDLGARLELNLGLNANTVWIGNVRLEEVESAEEPNGPKAPLADGNHVYNGTFDLGTMDRMKYWNVQTASTPVSAAASVNAERRALEVAIGNGGTDPKAVTVTQKGINLLQTDTYQLTFDAKAEAARTIGVRFVSKDGTVQYGAQSGIALDTDASSQTFTFTMPAQVTDAEGQLVFDLGGSSADVTLDNVKLIRTTNNNVDYSGINLFPLVNGDFTGGLSGWEPFTQGASAQFSAEGGVAKVAVASVGTEAWNVMLNQSGLELKKGLTYTLSFDARASVARDIEASLEDAGYNRHFQTGSLAIGSEWKTFAYEVKPTADANLALKLLLGKTAQSPAGPHDVFFRNMVLEVKDAPVKRPPLLLADATDNRLGQPVELTFADNAAWREAIASVSVDGQALAAEHYTVQSGILQLKGSAFAAVGAHTVTVKAAGYGDTTVKQSLIASDGNLLRNGSFAGGGEDWTHWEGDGGVSDFEVAEGAAKIAIHYNGGIHEQWKIPISWSTQFMQKDIKLEAGKTYELSFKASSTKSRPILIEFTGYNNNQKTAFAIKENAAVYRTTLQPAAPVTFTLNYLLGNVVDGANATPNEPHVITIDDVLLKEVKAAPALTADSTDNKVGSPIELTFADAPAWREAITAITVNGVTVPSEQAVVEAGRIQLAADLFPAMGTYKIGIEAEGYGIVSLAQDVKTNAPNVALGKTATASTASQPAASAVDGNGATRWESAAADPQWISVDLGKRYKLDAVVLNWEGAFGKTYKLQAATAAAPGEADWTDVYSEAAGNGAIDTIVLGGAEARHLRMTGTARGTTYGYSLWELEAYGVPAAGGADPGEEEPALLDPPVLAADVSQNKVGQDMTLTFPANAAWIAAVNGVAVEGRALVKDTEYSLADGSLTIRASVFPAADTYTVSVSAPGYKPSETEQVVAAADANLALGKSVTVSSHNAPFASELLTDGRADTRWEANWQANNAVEWVVIDLGAEQAIEKLKLLWERAYASALLVQVAADGADTAAGSDDWQTVATLDRTLDESSLAETVDLGEQDVRGRYVRLYMTGRGFAPYGPSLFEVGVF